MTVVRLCNSSGSQSVDVGHDINHGGPVCGKRLSERCWKRGSLFDANAKRTHVLSDARKIDFAEGP